MTSNRYITAWISPTQSIFFCSTNTGLGNAMFQIASTYGIARTLGLQCSFPNVELLGNNLETLFNYNHKYTIFRNILFDNYRQFENMASATDDISYTTNVHERDGFNKTYDEEIIHAIQNTSENVKIYGYLEDHAYFDKYKADILKMFEPDPDSYSYIYDKYFKDMTDYTIVSVHFRLEQSPTQGLFTTDEEAQFYRNSFEYIKQHVANPLFYIFVDDASKLDLSLFQTISYRIIDKELDYIHLWAMSMCNHNIIPGSTFSWWGAYLNEHEDKIVLYQKKLSWNCLSQFIGIE